MGDDCKYIVGKAIILLILYLVSKSAFTESSNATGWITTVTCFYRV